MECWKKVEGYDNYEVSSHGRIRNTQTNKLRKLVIGANGYYVCGLSKEGVRKSLSPHRLVGLAFIPNPDNLPQLNHIDGNRLNNRVENLEWSDAFRNMAHAYHTDLIKGITVLEKLKPLQVKNLKKPGMYSDGGNLWLKVSHGGTKSWIFRYNRNKRRRHMGLGSYPDVTLAEARDLAYEQRKLLSKFLDPIEERNKLKDAAYKVTPTFREVMKDYITSKQAGWTDKHKKQFENTLTSHAVGLMNIPIDDISTDDVCRVLKPIWETKNETASRVRGRIEMVLDYATVSEVRKGENPARWKGHLSHILPKRSDVSPIQHMKAIPYSDMSEFMTSLRKGDSISRKCLEFTILTACRVGSVAGARWDEIEDGIWTIPAERMKGYTGEFKVPLSKRALQLLKELPRVDDSPYLFPGIRKGHINVESPRKLLQKDMGYESVTVHGFRSTFRDWAAEMTNYQNHICEMALAHTIGSGVEAAYRRGELLAKRSKLMEDWSKFLESKPAKVTPIGKAHAKRN